MIGADGAGKSTVLERLEARLDFPVKRIYMGIRLESANHLLPTTRLLLAYRRRTPADAAVPIPLPSSRLRRVARRGRSVALMLNLLAEEWYRQAIAWIFARRGHLILFDRHFLADYYAFERADDDPSPPIGTRVHGHLLERWLPRPGLVIMLDAPPELLYARKPESPPERLARLREGYLESAGAFDTFEVIDASRPLETVIDKIADLVTSYYLNGRSRP